MATKKSITVDNNHFSVSKECWTAAVTNENPAAYAGLKAAASAIVAHDGAFMIDGGESGIYRRVDRGSELKELVKEADETRKSMGLKPVKD